MAARPELNMTGQDRLLTRKQKRRPAEFIAPFTVEPGSRVKVSRDFDPSLRGCIKKTRRASRCWKRGPAAVRISGLAKRGVREAEEGHIVGAERPVT